jgi:hypothetical protein
MDAWTIRAAGSQALRQSRNRASDGDQTLWLQNISPTAPDPQQFKIPEDYRVIDHRAAAAQPADSQR